MSSYRVGVSFDVTASFKDAAGQLTDPDTILLEYGYAGIADPVTATYPPDGLIVKDDVGLYRATITPDVVGTWVARWTGTGDVVAIEETEFDVTASAAPWATAAYPPVYATLSDLKARIGLNAALAGTSANLASRDDVLRQILQAASRHIDRRTKRRFYAVTEARVFRPDTSYHLDVGDLLSVTTMATDNDGDFDYESAWDPATDFFLGPLDAPSQGRPYRRIEVTPLTGRYWLPQWRSTLLGDRNYGLSQPSVQIAGVWGYCLTGAHPPEIREACLLYAIRLHKRPGAPFGSLENSMGGPPMKVGPDADFEEMIRDYILQEPLFV